MEGALARAVNSGAARLNQEFRAVMPDMMVLAGESNARGFHLDGYGVFFDVEVPVLRQSMMWSLRTMLDQDKQGATEALAVLALRGDDHGPERATAEAALRRLEAQLRPFGWRATRRAPGIVAPAPGRRPAIRLPASRRAPKPVNSALLNDPNKAYTDAVVQALIDAMVDYSLPMVSSMQPERVPDGGRPRQRAPRPAGAAQPLRRGLDLHAAHRGHDLAEYRAGKIDRDEAKKRVQVQEFYGGARELGSYVTLDRAGVLDVAADAPALNPAARRGAFCPARCLSDRPARPVGARYPTRHASTCSSCPCARHPGRLHTVNPVEVLEPVDVTTGLVRRRHPRGRQEQAGAVRVAQAAQQVGRAIDGVQINAIFRRVNEQEMWGEHYGWAVRATHWRPAQATKDIVLRSALGYTGEQPRMQILQHKDFIDAKVEMYLKKGSQVWAKLGEFPIERQLLRNRRPAPACNPRAL